MCVAGQMQDRGGALPNLPPCALGAPYNGVITEVGSNKTGAPQGGYDNGTVDFTQAAELPSGEAIEVPNFLNINAHWDWEFGNGSYTIPWGIDTRCVP